MKKFIFPAYLVVLVLLVFGSCDLQKEDSKKIELIYVNWQEGIALTNLAGIILEKELGYEVEQQVAYIGPVYASLAHGDKDVFLDAWLPVTHNDYIKEFGDQLTDLGVVFEKARLGLVVPDHSMLHEIPELKAKKDRFRAEIIGIDSGAGIMRKTEKALKKYGLEDVKLLSSSGPAMTTRLKEAIQQREEVVVTGWYPHWMFARYDLRFLKDPKKVYGVKEKIHKLSRKGFARDHPEAAAFLKNFKMKEKHLLAILNEMESTDEEPKEIALQWYQNHPEVVKGWLP